jgi:hypothetical protein
LAEFVGLVEARAPICLRLDIALSRLNKRLTRGVGNAATVPVSGVLPGLAPSTICAVKQPVRAK